MKVLFSFRNLLHILKERKAVSVKHIGLGPAIPPTEVCPQLSGIFQWLPQVGERTPRLLHWWGIQGGPIGSPWSVPHPCWVPLPSQNPWRPEVSGILSSFRIQKLGGGIHYTLCDSSAAAPIVRHGSFCSTM